MDFSNIFKGISFAPTEKDTYKSKGRFKTNIFFYILKGRRIGQYCDIRHYNTDKEREQYIYESIDSYSKFAEKYNYKIVGIKVDKQYWNSY